ncbi:MAG TPA: Crp/Fnr family transcriptional regulator [Ferruginibacter sp.]|nr:Crp/Fnr family transcriptional regulator [Chitinophagaceae bacterium]HRI25242.1 Crp/Fnr family transcriptional regulator [Ferruginibacter sp.]
MYTEIKYLYLKQHSVTTGLTDAQLLEMANLVKVKNVKKGESVYMEDGFDSRIYLLSKGRVKISEVDDRGDELIKEVLTATEIFGDVSLDGSVSDDEFAEALTENTVICSFKSSEFKQLMQTNVVLAMNFIQHVSGKFRKLESRHANLVFKDAKSRLISFFRDWARREGSREGDTIRLNNYLTHSDIAGIISTSRQSVTTLLNELKEGGVIYYNRKHIEFNENCFVN